MDLKDRLVELRKKSGLTQKEFAKKIQTTRDTYAQYEIGRRGPNIEMIEKIANAHGVSVDYLFGRPSKADLELLLNEYDLTWGDEELSKEQVKRAKKLLKAGLDVD